jgi:hypothetical protein
VSADDEIDFSDADAIVRALLAAHPNLPEDEVRAAARFFASLSAEERREFALETWPKLSGPFGDRRN